MDVGRGAGGFIGRLSDRKIAAIRSRCSSIREVAMVKEGDKEGRRDTFN